MRQHGYVNLPSADANGSNAAMSSGLAGSVVVSLASAEVGVLVVSSLIVTNTYVSY